MKTLFAFLLLTLLIVTSGVPETGTLTGTVTNAESKQLLPMTKVLLYRSGKGEPVKKILAQTGTFTEHKIPSGHYSVAAVHEGFGSIIARDVVIKADSVVELDFMLISNSARGDSSDFVRPGKEGVDYRMHYFKAQTK